MGGCVSPLIGVSLSWGERDGSSLGTTCEETGSETLPQTTSDLHTRQERQDLTLTRAPLSLSSLPISPSLLPGLQDTCDRRFSQVPPVMNSSRNSGCCTWRERAMHARDLISAKRRHSPNDALLASELVWAWLIEGGVVSRIAHMAEHNSGPTCNCFNGSISFWGGRSLESGTSRVLLGPKQ